MSEHLQARGMRTFERLEGEEAGKTFAGARRGPVRGSRHLLVLLGGLGIQPPEAARRCPIASPVIVEPAPPRPCATDMGFRVWGPPRVLVGPFQ